MAKKKPKTPRDKPLAVKVTGGVLTISIGIDTLKYAAEHHEEFWQPLTDKFSVVVSNSLQFARDVRNELESEDEEGSTAVHLLLDKMIYQAVDQGSEGLDCDAMDALEDAERKENGNSAGDGQK